MELIIQPNWSNQSWETLIGKMSVYQIMSNGELWLYSSVEINKDTRLRIKQGLGISEGIVTNSYAVPFFGWAVFVKKTSGFFTLAQVTSVEKLVDRGLKFYLDGSFNLELNLRIFDLKELKKSSPFTKTIDIPFTDNNNKVFSQIYNINLESGYNPKKKSDCLITDGGILISSGYLQLQDIDLPNKIYKCVFYGENKNLFDDIGENLLFGNPDSSNDINLDALNHNKWKSEIEAGWNGERDFIYGLIKTDVDNYTLSYLRGSGLNLQGVEPSRWRPLVRAKSVLDAIFNRWGYEYESTFLNSEEFLNVMSLPSIVDTPGKEIVKYTVGDPVGLTYSITPSGNNSTNLIKAETQITDPFTGGSWNSYEFTAPYTDNFKFSGSINFVPKGRVSVFPNTVQQLENERDILKIVPVVYRRGIEIWTNENWEIKSGRNAPQPINVGGQQGGFQVNQGFIPVSRIQFQNKDLGIKLQEGDKVIFRIKIIRAVSGSSTYTTTGINTGSGIISPQGTGENQLFPSEPVDFIRVENDRDFVNVLPLFGGLKQIDFVGDLFKMFNLYIKPDKINPRKFLIEPRDFFYSRGRVISDLEYDVNSVNISYLIDLAAKKYTFTYAKGDDTFNKNFSEANRDRVYGDAIVELDNDFLTNEKKIQLTAVPTYTAPVDALNYIYLPNLQGAGSAAKSRFLYWNGKVDVPISLKYTFYTSATAQLTATYSYYPGFSGFSNVYDPNSASLFYGTNNNSLQKEGSLYFKYWENEIETYAEPSSHILTIDVKLNSKIWTNIDYNDIYYFELDGSPHYYTLLSIEGYDPTETNMVKMKFLSYYDFRSKKPKRSRLPISDITDRIGGGNDTINPNLGDLKPVSGGIKPGNGGGVIGGKGDTVNVVYTGKDLALGGNNRNIIAIGDGIVIKEGASNVFLFGTDGATIEGDTDLNIVSFGGSGTTFSATDDKQFRINNLNLVMDKKSTGEDVPYPVDGMLVYEGANVLKAYDAGVGEWFAIGEPVDPPAPPITATSYNWALTGTSSIVTPGAYQVLDSWVVTADGNYLIIGQIYAGITGSGLVEMTITGRILNTALPDALTSGEISFGYSSSAYGTINISTLVNLSAGNVIEFEVSSDKTAIVYSSLNRNPTAINATQWSIVRMS